MAAEHLDRAVAAADLGEALEIAERGHMLLHAADAHLEWARLDLAAGDEEGASRRLAGSSISGSTRDQGIATSDDDASSPSPVVGVAGRAAQVAATAQKREINVLRFEVMVASPVGRREVSPRGGQTGGPASC